MSIGDDEAEEAQGTEELQPLGEQRTSVSRRPGPQETDTGVRAVRSLGATAETVDVSGAADPSLPDGSTRQRLGRYEVKGVLGSGGQGEVFLAYDPLLKREVAIKSTYQTSQSALRRFRREAQFSAGLDHENVCKVYDVIADESRSYIVMEYVEGVSLHGMLKERRGALALDDAISILLQAAQGLEAAHHKGIVHRDLKTENVLVTKTGRAKITDFGIARQADEDHNHMTREGAIVGTARAMSPEQTLSEPADERSDLFSFGVLCYETLSGKSPFLAPNQLDTLRRVRTFDPPHVGKLVPEIPERLAAFVMKLMAKPPADRPASASEVVAVLEQAQGQLLRTTGPQSVHGERRQVTVLACDLAAEDEREEEDSERLLAVRAAYRREVEQAVDKHGGSVRSVYGTSYLACFGFPTPHEDAARRAVAAALDIRAAVRALAGQDELAEGLTIRGGVHSGVAAMSVDKHGEPELGRLPAIASMLRDSAPPGDVLVTDACRNLLRSDAVYGASAELGFGKLRQTAHLVERLASTLDLLDNAGDAPLVGRSGELQIIVGKCRRAWDGNGQVVVLTGEPGIGKSRLVRAVHDELGGDSGDWLVAAGAPDGKQTPLLVAATLLRQAMGIQPNAAPLEQRKRCVQRLNQARLPQGDYLAFLCSVLQLPAPEEFKLSAWVTPEKQRVMMLEALASLFCGLAERRPQVLVVEDLHWVDASSLELLSRIVERCETVPLFVLATSRPESELPWTNAGNVTRFNLEPLTAKESEDLLGRAPGGGVAKEIVNAIVARAGGNPLFLEQMVRGVAATADGKDVKLPPSLRELLTARLHASGAALALAQAASVIGREFTTRLLEETPVADRQQIEGGLRQLTQHDLVQRKRGFGATATWAFKHALIRDAAYDTLLARQRKALHADVKKALERVHPDIAKEQPQLLAYHCEEAGLVEDAVGFWQAAAMAAAGRSAHQEALGLYDRALAQAKQLSPEKQIGKELELQAYKGVSALTSQGYASQTVEECFGRAHEICETIGVFPFPIFYGTWVLSVTRAYGEASAKHAERVRKVLEESQDATELLMANNCLAVYELFRGNYEDGIRYYEGAKAKFDPATHLTVVATYGGCGGYYAHIYAPYELLMQGKARSARDLQDEVLRLAESLNHPYTLVLTRMFAALHAYEVGRIDDVRDLATAALEVSERYGIGLMIPIAQIAKGWALAAQEPQRRQEAMELVTVGNAGYQGSGTLVLAAQWLCWKADAERRLGDLEAALSTLDEAMQLNTSSSMDHYYDSAMMRRKAAVLLALGRKVEAEALLGEAIEASVRGGHGLFELQARVAQVSNFGGDAARAALAQLLGRLEPFDDAPLFVEARRLTTA